MSSRCIRTTAAAVVAAAKLANINDVNLPLCRTRT